MKTLIAFKKILGIVLSLVLLGGMGYGFWQARHSSLFLVQEVEIRQPVTSGLPISIREEELLQLAAVPVGKVSLFDLDLRSIEERLLSHFWIKNVILEKRLPHTLYVTIHYREPRAYLQTPKGGLVFVDEDGDTFGWANVGSLSDLPLLTGFGPQDVFKIKAALDLISRWDRSSLSPLSEISTVHWDPERGFRILISYSRDEKANALPAQLDSRIRTIVDIGQEVDDGLGGRLLRLSSVIRYLSGNSIAARQIWADVGKKIVVKTTHGT